ncbi:MAG: fibronectin type III domain-containing protein [Acidimicrobiales bacterium]
MIDSRVTSVLPTMIRRSLHGGRSLMVASTTVAVLSLSLLSFSSAGAVSYWSNAIEMPGLTTLNQTTASTGPIVCTSSGNCVSGGEFTDGSSAEQAFVSQETNGVWSSATEVAAALNVGGMAAILAISCPSAGSCTAEGSYTDNAQSVHTFVISQTSGTWGFPTEVPDFTTLKSQDASFMTTLSCTSSTTCVGVGSYVDHVTQTAQPIVFTETNGVWAAPSQVQGSAQFNPSGDAFVGGLDCPSVTTCVAGGDVETASASSTTVVPFLISESDGAWGPMEAVPGVAALSRSDEASLTALSCGAPGDCVAGGDYLDAAGQSQAYLLNEVGGTWGNATQLFATQLLGSGLNNNLVDVDCPTAGNCSGIGGFADAQGNFQPFVVNEVNHVWSPASEVPGIRGLNDNDGAAFTTISCSAPGVCSAGGTYADADSNAQAFLVNETSNVWSVPIEVPGTSKLNKGGSATIYEVSCSEDGGCGVQGSYTDAQSNVQLFVVNSSAVAPTMVSSAPRHVTATDTKGVITVRWSAPANDGGATVTSYTVVSLPKARSCTTSSTSCTFKGLNKKVHYSFEVRATNADGSSALSARSNAVRDT